MGAEGSVTLQLREAVQAPDAGTSLEHGGLTIGYPDPEMLADMLGSFQSASAGAAGLGGSEPSSAFDLIQDSSSSNCSNSRQSGLDPAVDQQQQQQQHCLASALLAKASAAASASPTGSSSSSSSGAGSSSNNAGGGSSLTLSGIKSEIGK